MSQFEKESSSPTATGSTSSTDRAGASPTRGALSGKSYGDQVASLSPRVQGKEKTPAAAPPTTDWTRVVRANFKDFDKDGDGWIEHHEVAAMMKDPSVKGEKAAAVAGLHRAIEEIEELSNDETGDENDGVTLADITAYERAKKGGTLPKKAGHGEGQYWTGKGQIDQADKLKKLPGAAKAGSAKNELFPNGVPSLSALRQGGIADCYFLAAVGSVIARNPADLVNMIKRNVKKGKLVSYTVTFPGKGYGTVTIAPPTDAEIARYSSAGSDGLWLIVMEKAYAESRSGKNADIDDTIAWDSLSRGVDPMSAKGSDTDDLWATGLDTTKKKIDSALNGKKKKIVTANISSTNDLKLPKSHVYSIIAFDGTWITGRNPWGSNPGVVSKTKDFVLGTGGNFKIKLAKFDDVFSSVCYQE